MTQAAVLLILFLLTAMLACPVPVRAAQDGAGEGQEASSGLVIEVVGEHSIDDEVIVEDEDVPLAMFSEEPADSGVRHAAAMGIVFCCAVGYVLYCRRCEKRIFALRRQAAEEQRRMTDRRQKAGRGV